jgi:hypothetical protein
VARSRVPLYTLGQDLSSPYRGDLREIRFATDPGRFRFPLCRADKGIHYADRGCPAITAQIPGVSHRFAPRLPTALEPSENGPKSGLPLRKRRIPGAPSEYRALPGARSRRHAPSAPVPSARATVPRFIARGRDPPHPKRKRRRGGPHTPRTPALGLLQLHAVGQPLPRLHQSEAPGEPLAVLLRPRSACSRQRRLHADTSSTSCA